jgi:hypothetical protein
MACSVDAGDGRRDFLTIRSDARESEWLSSGWARTAGGLSAKIPKIALASQMSQSRPLSAGKKGARGRFHGVWILELV